MGMKLSDTNDVPEFNPSEPNDLPEINPVEAMNRLDEGLENCRSVIADYRAALIANGGAQNGSPGDEVVKPPVSRD